jgi:hypothetical protein
MVLLNWGKIKVCGDKTVTRCHPGLGGVFQLLKEVTCGIVFGFTMPGQPVLEGTEEA